MSDENGFLLQTLQNLNASIIALNARLDKMDEVDSQHGVDIAVLQDRASRNAVTAITSLVGALGLALIKAMDFLSGK